jgi:hypothetical protein
LVFEKSKSGEPGEKALEARETEPGQTQFNFEVT